MLRKKSIEEIINFVGECFKSALLTAIEEQPDKLPYTIAASHFLDELLEHNIILNFGETFEGDVLDMILRETSEYLAR